MEALASHSADPLSTLVQPLGLPTGVVLAAALIWGLISLADKLEKVIGWVVFKLKFSASTEPKHSNAGFQINQSDRVITNYQSPTAQGGDNSTNTVNQTIISSDFERRSVLPKIPKDGDLYSPRLNIYEYRAEFPFAIEELRLGCDSRRTVGGSCVIDVYIRSAQTNQKQSALIEKARLTPNVTMMNAISLLSMQRFGTTLGMIGINLYGVDPMVEGLFAQLVLLHRAP
jgi:hypothetical protein